MTILLIAVYFGGVASGALGLMIAALLMTAKSADEQDRCSDYSAPRVTTRMWGPE